MGRKTDGVINKLRAAGPKVWRTHKQKNPPTGKEDSESSRITLLVHRKPFQNKPFPLRGFNAPINAYFREKNKKEGRMGMTKKRMSPVDKTIQEK